MTETVVRRTELLTPGPALALAGVLEVPVPDLEGEEGLPLFWHWVYLLEQPRQSDLGRDGHPARGGFPPPPGEGLRRMFAGGRIQTSGRLTVGVEATRHSRIVKTTVKKGRSGRLTFVTVGHQISQQGQVVIDEQQDLVYREPAPAPAGSAQTNVADPQSAATPEPPAGAWSIEVTPTLLFRFSALTYNAHRIHYDRDYATGEEGYPGLLTHGPLQVLAMAELARARGVADPAGHCFVYRLIAPLFDHQGLVVAAETDGATTTTTVSDRSGRPTAQGTLTPTTPQ